MNDCERLVIFTMVGVGLCAAPSVTHLPLEALVFHVAFLGILILIRQAYLTRQFDSVEKLVRATRRLVFVNGIIWGSLTCLCLLSLAVKEIPYLTPGLPRKSFVAGALNCSLLITMGITSFCDWLERPLVRRVALGVLAAHREDLGSSQVAWYAWPIHHAQVTYALDQLVEEGLAYSRGEHAFPGGPASQYGLNCRGMEVARKEWPNA